MTVFVIDSRQENPGFGREILGISVTHCIARSIAAAGYQLREVSDPAAEDILVTVLAPAPLIEASSWKALAVAAEKGGAQLVCGETVLAVAGIGEGLTSIRVSGKEGLLADTARGVLQCQEELRRRISQALLDNDVQLVDPAATFVSPGAVIEPGCMILPGCHIYGDTVIGEGSVIGPNCYIHNAHIGKNVRVNASQIYSSRVGDGTTIGPFAHIRPGCEIGANVRIGDFVELKNTRLGEGTKASHLTYLADADLGDRVNVGCGAITVNYDGFKKHRTIVEDGAFIGCNVNLVAPVTVGEGAYLAAGVTVTRDVEKDALAIGRARQESKPGWATGWREKNKPSNSHE